MNWRRETRSSPLDRALQPLARSPPPSLPLPQTHAPQTHAQRPLALRTAAALPVLLTSSLLWLAFDARTEVVARALTAFAFSWLGVFKIVGLLLGRGPLSPAATGRTWTLPQFAFILTLPVSPRYGVGPASASATATRGGGGRTAPRPLHRVPSRTRVGEAAPSGLATRLRVAAGKAATLATVVALLERDRSPHHAPLPAALRPWCYLFGLYTFLGLTYDGIAAAAVAIPWLRLDLSPHFDHPFCSVSFADLCVVWPRQGVGGGAARRGAVRGLFRLSPFSPLSFPSHPNTGGAGGGT